jgi:hypothetical protein
MSSSGRNGSRAKSAFRPTLVVGLLTLAVLALSVPGALRDAAERGSFYLFSADFLRDLPKRLAGPGRLRFVIQPIMAILLGISYPGAAVIIGPVLIGLPYALSRTVAGAIIRRRESP